MSRSKIETCMICDEVPCSCGTVRRTVSVPKSAPVQKVGGATAAIAAQVAKQKREAHERRFAPPAHRAQASVNVDDALLASALRNLEPIMHPESREKFRAVLTSPPSQDERAAVWKATHHV